MLLFLAVLLAYILGSLSSAIIVCKILGYDDPRTQGSKNPGATNVLRLGGKKAAAIVLLGDMLKGFIPVFCFRYLHWSSASLSLIACAAFFGHLYPIFFRFKGGKGVATALGCLLALNFSAGFFCLLTWLIVAIVSRYSSLASLLFALLAPIYFWFMTYEINYVFAITLMSIFLIFKHKENVKRLYSRTESKIGNRN